MEEREGRLLIVSDADAAQLVPLRERWSASQVSYRAAATVRGRWDVVLLVAPRLVDGRSVLVNVSAPFVALGALAGEVELWERAGVEIISDPLADAQAVAAALLQAQFRPEVRDPLTGLLNREGFLATLRAIMAGLRHEAEQRAAVLIFDLDCFTLINDSLGHSRGDDVLVELAERLRGCLRRSDRLARVGADEFATVLVGAEIEKFSAAIADRVIAQLERSLVIDGQEIFPSASVGTAVARPSDEPDAVLCAADTAVRRAKLSGRGGRVRFLQTMRVEARAQLQLEVEIRQGIPRDEFILYYQPVVCTETGQVRSMEALVRWAHPERGILPPGVFLPLAEETGLILPMSWKLLARACREAAQWAGPGAPSVSVNLAAEQLTSSELLARVRDALARSGLPPQRLKLEITESSLLDHRRVPPQLFESLQALGVDVVLDDFGTGYCSLAYLERYPLQGLKIDRSFVQQLLTDKRCRVITRHILALGRDLEMSVVAEGVETAAELACLQELRCELLQGYYFARPMPLSAVAAYLAAARRKSA